MSKFNDIYFIICSIVRNSLLDLILSKKESIILCDFIMNFYTYLFKNDMELLFDDNFIQSIDFNFSLNEKMDIKYSKGL